MTTKPSQPLPPRYKKLASDGDHDYMTATMLSFFLGSLGIDRFYLGYTKLGIAKLLTLGGLGLWYAIDLVLISTGAIRDAKEATLADYGRNHQSTWKIIALLWLFNAIGSLFSMAIMIMAVIVIAKAGA